MRGFDPRQPLHVSSVRVRSPIAASLQRAAVSQSPQPRILSPDLVIPCAPFTVREGFNQCILHRVYLVAGLWQGKIAPARHWLEGDGKGWEIPLFCSWPPLHAKAVYLRLAPPLLGQG